MRPLVAPLAAAALAGTAASTNAATGEGQAAPSGSATVRRLLAIRQASNGERSALLGDRWLRVGDRYTAPEGDTEVTAIGVHHIELLQGKLRSTYQLLAPLLPPQWPVLPAASAGSPPPASRFKTPPAHPAAPSTAPSTAPSPAPSPASPAATATRTERP